MTIHRIQKGFDIRLAGKPEAKIENAAEPLLVGLVPREFPGVKPKLHVREGDTVATGDVLFHDKQSPAVRWLSPATGKVQRIVLGARRFPELIEISPETEERFAEVPTIKPEELPSMDGDAVAAAVQGAGLWPLLRQRPVGKIASVDRRPAAIYINGMDTEPLAADPAFAVDGLGAELQLGIEVMRKLVAEGGNVYLTIHANRVSPNEFQNAKGAAIHQFDGPHPAGLVGTHISRISPLKSDEAVWYLKAQEVAVIGAWIKQGHYPTQRVVALAGEAAPTTQYYRVRQGAAMMTLTGGKPLEGDVRIINGTVLNGTSVAADGYLGFYANTVTVIPEGGDKRDLFGWALPQFGKLSANRQVFSWLMPKPEYSVDARLHGGPRNMVNIGQMENVTPLDIHPTFLIRAIQAGDLEEALELGLLEVTEEDVALCTFADPCKTEVGDIVRQGLDLYEKEG